MQQRARDVVVYSACTLLGIARELVGHVDRLPYEASGGGRPRRFGRRNQAPSFIAAECSSRTRACKHTHNAPPCTQWTLSRPAPSRSPPAPSHTHYHACDIRAAPDRCRSSISSDRALLPTAVSCHRSTALTPTAKLPATQRLAAASRQLNAAAPAPALSAGTAGSTTGHGAVMVGESTSGLLAT
jgi:hypothetical protein